MVVAPCARVMKYAPLETFITVKSMTPVLFCVCEYLFLGRALPNLKSVGALAGIVGRGLNLSTFQLNLCRVHSSTFQLNMSFPCY